MDSLMTVLMNKGFLIGFFSGLMKVMQSMRAGTFKWFIAITDVIGSTVVGYSVYMWAGESLTLEEWQVVSITIMLSINAFFVIHMITNKSFIQGILATYMPRLPKADISEEKDNEDKK